MIFWELIIAYPNGGPSAKFCPPWLKPLVTPLDWAILSQTVYF